MQVLMVRSAATQHAEDDRLRGRSAAGLTSSGRLQATALARDLADLPIERLVTSPLARARETAEAIASRIGLPAVVEEGLTDIDTGRWTGMNAGEAMRDDPAAFDRYRRFPQAARFPGGESMADAERRVIGVLRELHDPEEGVAVAVSHELLIRLVLARLRAYDGFWLWVPPVPPASSTPIQVDRDGLSLPGVLNDLLRRGAERAERRWQA